MRWGLIGALATVVMIAQPAAAQAGRLAFEADGEIWTMSADGSERQRLTRTPGESESSDPDWSPDGSRIAFTRGDEDQDIWIRDQAAASERRVTNVGRSTSDSSPDWLADGRRIAFVRVRIGSNRISSSVMTVDVDSGRQRRLHTLASRRRLVVLGEVAVSPDGRRLLYTQYVVDRDGIFRPTLFALDMRSRKSTKLADDAQTGSWSPDGTRIAFSSVSDSNGKPCGREECSLRGELYVTDADGGSPVRLTENVGDDRNPTWAPNGSAIVFASSRNSPEGDNYELYAIRPDGSCLTWLTNGTVDSARPNWQPGSGGLPEPFACGAVPREPADLVTPRGPGMWLGPIGPRNVMLADDDDGFMTYDDCPSFEPSDCGPELSMQTGPVCRDHPLRTVPQADDVFEVGRGALVYRAGGDVQVYSGDHWATIFNEDQAATETAIDALRPLPSADPVASLEPPRFPARVIEQIEQARRLGSVSAIVRRTKRSRSRAQQLLGLARALEPLGKLQPADC